MNARVDRPLQDAMSLSETEHVALAGALYASLDGPAEDPAEAEGARDNEVTRRVEAIRSGTAKLMPLDQVRSDLKATIRRVQAR